MLKAKNVKAWVFALILFVIAGCGGGSGSSTAPTGSTQDSSAPTGSTKQTISGSVALPAGATAESVSVISLGKTSTVTTQGNFSTKVYQDGVTAVAAMPQGKSFGLMNIVASESPITSTGGTAKVVAASSTSDSPTIALSTKTTAVSLVFISPYFLTNDPVKAANIIKNIESDPTVNALAAVIEKVFNDADPMNNPDLQQALQNTVQSVLNTVASQSAATAKATTKPSLTRVINLPRQNFLSKVVSALTASSPYYADQNYITIKAASNGSTYDLSAESVNGGSIDWISEVVKLDKTQFTSLDDFQGKQQNNRTVYADERAQVVGKLNAPAKSVFRYVDLLSLAFDKASEALFGTSASKASISSDEDGVYLIRTYSGAWDSSNDVGEKTFLRGQVPNGSFMDKSALVMNITTATLDAVSIFVDLKEVPLSDLVNAGISVAQAKIGTEFLNGTPTFPATLSLFGDIFEATITEGLKNLTQQGFIIMIGKGLKSTAGSLFDWTGKISSGGKVADRFAQMINSASPLGVPLTPMETTLVVVGNPFPASPPPAITPHSISGRVTSNDVGLAGVTVTLSGTASNSTVTDANGGYAFTNAANGTYSIAVVKAGYNFTPPNINNLTVNGADIVDQNFSANVAQSGNYSIGGTIHSWSNSGPVLSGATVSIAGMTATTSSAGTFSITGIPAGTYAFSVSKSGYDTFTNPAYNVGSNQIGLNFYLTQPAVTYSMSGTIHSGSNSGPALSEATVSIAGKTATTSSTGTFSITGIPAGTYAFSVSKSGYATYTNLAYNIGSSQIDLNFYLLQSTGTFAISGMIHAVSNSGPTLSGAIVSIAGKIATTSSTGTFSITGIPAGTYAFSVSKSGFDTYTNPTYYVGTNQNSLNFYLNPSPPFGALAINYSTGSAGLSGDYATIDSSNQRALQECGVGCSIIAVYGKGTCTVYAMGSSSYSWVAGWAVGYPTLIQATSIAISECSKIGTGCTVKLSGCN